jgi:aminoacrylate peracid reductase
MKVGNTVFVPGTMPNDASGNVVGKGDIAAQTEHVLESIKRVLEAAGASMEDVVMNHIFITDYANYARMNEVYARYFDKTRPARYCVKAELVNPEWLVEIASVAVMQA